MGELYHYGVLHRSGRYTEGSGENPYQCGMGIRAFVAECRANNIPDTEIASYLGMSTTVMRQRISLEKEEQTAKEAALAVALKDKGCSNVAIAERLGISEGSVRNRLAYSQKKHESNVRSTANVIAEQIRRKGVVDVGAGNEVYLGISATKLKTAVSLLRDDGFEVYDLYIPQLGTKNKTTVKVAAMPGISKKDIYADLSKIKLLEAYSEDGQVIRSVLPPVKIDPSRVMIQYAEDGGVDKDGVIEIRKGVPDLSLGMARYAQVRIAVEGDRYLKGMAVYSDDLPPGVDIRFNTNKHRGTSKMDVLKKMTDDPYNPFKASIKEKEDLIKAQRFYIGKDGKEHQSALNIVNEEGDWSKWSKTLSSQFLSKQNVSLVKQQLSISLKEKQEEFEKLSKLTNPVVKKTLLDSFSDDCDAASVHLKAAGMPRQASHVILPFPGMKPNEVYAPNYRDGEKLVLVRHPHAGRFELPELVVNNRYPEAKKMLGNAPDAIGIHPKVAEQLSGADFDGDTVLCLPNNNGAIKVRSPLKQLNNFDPKAAYPGVSGMKVMTSQQTQIQMGIVSNLITDMTLKKATDGEIARAVKHSMVVIDAEKHGLNYILSEEMNGIAGLKKKYQPEGGSSTLISRSKSPVYINERREGKLVVGPDGKSHRIFVDPNTGEKLYEETGRMKTTWDPISQTRVPVSPVQERVHRMAVTKDARELSSGTPVENEYARYSNALKALANRARKEMVNTPTTHISKEAKIKYAPQVETLRAKLDIALMNQPLERNAQALANAWVNASLAENPEMTKDSIKKLKGKELKRAREATGAAKQRIYVENIEWEAIQAGAISTNLLQRIVGNADMDRLQELATPRDTQTLSGTTLERAIAMKQRGYTQAQIADSLGVSVSVLKNSI